MTKDEMQEIMRTKTTARCECCGHNWELERGDAFSCPFCYNSPEELVLSGSLVVLEDDGQPRFKGRFG